MCGNEPGLMQQASQIYSRNGEAVKMAVEHNVKDNNSVVGWILHTEQNFDPNSSQIIAYNTTGSFSSPGKELNNTLLYVTAITEQPNAEGLPQVEHDCTVWTPNGASVVFMDEVDVIPVDEICNNGEYYLTVTIAGGDGSLSPNAAYASVSDGKNTFQNVSAGEELTLSLIHI